MGSKLKFKSVNQFLCALRLKAGIALLEAAQYLGHSTAQYISNLEREKCDASIEMAIKPCAFYRGDLKSLEKLFMGLYRNDLDRLIGKKASGAGKRS